MIEKAWYYFILDLAKFAFWLLGGIRVVGRPNVPKDGALIVAPNHVSHLDPPVTACAIHRMLRFMAKEELFKAKGFGWLIRSVGAFPVRRGEGDTEAIRVAIDALEKGQAVLVFPEGSRGDGAHLQPVNRGVAMLAKRTGAKVLPVGIVGTHKAWPKGQKKINRGRIVVAFGEPFTYEQTAKGANERENRDLFGEELRARIAKICGENGLLLKIERSSEDSKTLGAPAPSI